MAYNKTPILQIPRQQGGTLYVFPSAMEDVGLNLNTRANSVAMSHYALLDIPECNPAAMSVAEVPSTLSAVNKKNFFNITLNCDFADNASDESGLTGSEALARSLQNYAMNLETVLLNRDEYNYQEYETVSERVFWKWLKETGAVRFNKYGEALNKKQYFVEDNVEDYTSVVKCLGSIDSGNSVNGEFGMFNETYLNIPSSYGAGRIFFKTLVDNNQIANYPLGATINYTRTTLEGRDADNDEIVYTENKPYTDHYGSVYSITESTGVLKPGKLTTISTGGAYSLGQGNPSTMNSVRVCDLAGTKYAYMTSNLDGIEIVKDLDIIKKLMSRTYDVTTLRSYDDINIESKYAPAREFEFNAILLYYSIYDNNNFKAAPLATNLFGVLFLDNPKDLTIGTGHQVNFVIPKMVKKMSTSAGFGTGYSFRINIKTQSVYDNTDSVINDNTTSNAVLSDDFNGIIGSLNNALDALNVNVEVTKAIQDQYARIIAQNNSNDEKIANLDKKINSYIAGDRAVSIDTNNVTTSSLKAKGGRLDLAVYNNETEDYAQIGYVDVTGLTLKSGLDVETIKADREYVNVVKYYGDTSINIQSLADSDKTILDNMFKKQGLRVMKATINESYQLDSSVDGVVTKTTYRNDEFYIDPDSSIFNISTNMTYLLADVVEGYDEYLNTSHYKNAGVDYNKLIPYIVCELQRINKRLDELSAR